MYICIYVYICIYNINIFYIILQYAINMAISEPGPTSTAVGHGHQGCAEFCAVQEKVFAFWPAFGSWSSIYIYIYIIIIMIIIIVIIIISIIIIIIIVIIQSPINPQYTKGSIITTIINQQTG